MGIVKLGRKLFAGLLLGVLAAATLAPMPSFAAPAAPEVVSQSSAVGGFTFEIAPVDSQYEVRYFAGEFGNQVSYNQNSRVFTVTGMVPGQQDFVRVEIFDPVSLSYSVRWVYGDALMDGLDPTFGQPVSTLDGFFVEILNFDNAFDYSVISTDGTASINDSTGVLGVAGLPPGSSSTVTVTTAREGYADGSGSVTESALQNALVPAPSLSLPVSTADGYTFRILNLGDGYSPLLPLATNFEAGISVRRSGDLVTVTGLAPGASLSFSVKFVADWVEYEPTTVTGSALARPATPAYPSAFAQSDTTAWVTWGSVNGATGYRVTTTPAGRSCVATVNYCVISGLTSGQNYAFNIFAINGSVESSAAVTPSVLMTAPLSVAGSLSSSTWKVGSAVAANPLIVGQYSIIRYQWFRCAAPVAVQPAAPACDLITGATGASYTLSTADLGKFVSAQLTVTGGSGVVTATLANTRAVLAANATGGALVDPDGKPLIAEIPTREISIVGGTTITITGTGFTGVTSVLVNGTAATVLSATDTTLVISVPASTQVGLVDLAVTTPKGTITEASALAYVAKQVSISSKKKTLTGFSGSVTKLSKKQKAEIKAFVKANATMPKLSCSASTVGVKKSKAEAKAAVARAKSACSYASLVSKNLFTSANGTQGKAAGKVRKLVTLTISN